MSGIPSDDPFVQFCWEYPGPIGSDVEDDFSSAINAGVKPEALVAQARAYRRLCDFQDTLPVSADIWLAAVTETFDDDGGPSEEEAFSAALRALRAVKQMSREVLAERAEVAVRTIAQIENEPETNTTRRATRLTIADALGWSVDQMVELGCQVLAR